MGVTVSRAALTVTASGGPMTYGGTPPAITASCTGFAHGDSAASLTTGGWRLAGTLSRYAMSSATGGTLTGTGSLYCWNKSLNHGHGGWQLARTTVAFTAGFTATTRTSPGSFGIQISYTPVPQSATLPNSSPVTLKSGKIVIAA